MAGLDPERAARLLRDLGAADDLIGGRYLPGPELGRGGMGVVREALDTELERTIALKLLGGDAGLAPEARARFAREAKLTARLSHPHIASVHDATPDWIAMQLVRGPSLAGLEVDSPLLLARLIRDAALGLHHAHEAGIVHRDVKPGNLLVEAGERAHVFVTDFGLGAELRPDRAADEAATSAARDPALEARERTVAPGALSRAGAILGTPGFLAPEQAAGELERVGPATDVWGLGATLFAKLAGRPPFPVDDLPAHLREVVERPAPDLRHVAPSCPRDLALIAARCLERDPARRYPSALELAGDLDRFLRGEAVLARPPSALYRLRRFAGRRRAALAAATLTAAVALAVGLPLLIDARLRRSVAERQQRLIADVLALDGRVEQALDSAAAARAAGSGAERAAPALLESALAETRAFLELHDLPHARLLEGRLLHALDRELEALQAFDAAEALGDAPPGLALERGLTLAALYRHHLPILREDPHPLLDAWRARGADDLGRALSPDTSLTRTPRHRFARGMHAWLVGQPERARDALRETLEMDVGHRDAHLALARLYPLLGRPELGMRHSVIATDLMRGRRPTYAAAAAVAGAAGGPPDALHEPLELAGIDELGVDFHLILQRGPSEHATRGLRAQTALRRAAESFARGTPAAARADLEAARQELDAALAMDGSRPSLWLTRGLTHALLARANATDQLDPAHTTRALTDYGRALDLDPDLAPALYDRALLQLRRARLASAMRRPAEAVRWRSQAATDLERCGALAGASAPWAARLAALRQDASPALDPPRK